MRAALLASVFLAFAPVAFAQETVNNDQYALRGSTSITSVDVGHAQDVGATAVASGNAVATAAEGADTALNSTQHMDGDAEATADATVWDAHGTVAIASAAVANGATATASGGDIDLHSTQYAHGDAAATTNFTGGRAGDASFSSSASGNVEAVSAENGDIRAISTQESTGQVSATTTADLDAATESCCTGGQAVADAIASANNAAIAGTTTTMLSDTTQDASGSSAARVDLYVGSATDVVGNATANGNAVTADNAWGYQNTRTEQTSTATVTAESYVTLDNEFSGFASAGAYGVGNSTIASNVGSDTVLDVTQENAGDINASAALAGEGGEQALASSAAYGNVVTGSLCGYCDTTQPSLTASNTQVNDGGVHSSASVTAPRANTVAATASAIGNAATFQVTGAPGG